MDRHVATIVDMNYEIYHHYLSLDIQEDRKGSIGFIISDPLQNKINDDNSIIDVKKEPCSAVINYISYIPMDSKDIIALNEILPEIRLSK